MANASEGFKSRLAQFRYLRSSHQSSDASPASSILPDRKRVMANEPVKAEAEADSPKLTTPQSKHKRQLSASESPDPRSSTPSKRRSTTKERSANDPHSPKNLLVDSLQPGLTLVFVGLNPGLTTAATGHAYAHASNLFWKILHSSSITPIRHHPSETRSLMALYGIGNMNLCTRPTRAGDGLSRDEQEAGAVVLERKIREVKPEAVCIVGKGIWEVIWKVKLGRKMRNGEFRWGWQEEGMWLGRGRGEEQGGGGGEVVDGRQKDIEWNGARTFVATSTSGLAATLRPEEKLAIWKPLGEWFSLRRAELLQERGQARMQEEGEKDVVESGRAEAVIKEEENATTLDNDSAIADDVTTTP